MRNKFRILAIAMLLLFVAANALAITISVTRSYKIDRESVREGTIDFDSSYPTGGEAVTAANFNLSSIRWMDIRNTADASGNYRQFEFVDASSNIKVRDASGNEIGNGTSLSTLTGVKFRVFGY